MPPHTNRATSFAGPKLRLGRRLSAESTCRQAVLSALRVMPGVQPGLSVTADDVCRFLVSSGVQYPGDTVYKTMSRMSDALERVDGGFRLR